MQGFAEKRRVYHRRPPQRAALSHLVAGANRRGEGHVDADMQMPVRVLTRAFLPS